MDQSLWIEGCKRNQSKLSQFGINQIGGIKKMVKAKVTESVMIPEGEHTGLVEKNEIRKTPQGYEYHETIVTVLVDGKTARVRVGVPFSITDKSKLGKMLTKFGCPLSKLYDTEIDTDEYIKGSVVFSVVIEKTDRGEFYRCVADTFRPSKGAK